MEKYKITTDEEWFGQFKKVAKQIEDLKFLFQNEGLELTEAQAKEYEKEFYAAKRALNELGAEATFRIYFGKPNKIGENVNA